MRIGGDMRISGGPMVTGAIFSPRGANAEDSGPFWRRLAEVGDHPMVTAAPSCRGMQQPPRKPPGTAAAAEAPAPDPKNFQPMSARQKVALMLDKAGYRHAEIARRMGLRHRETATRLI